MIVIKSFSINIYFFTGKEEKRKDVRVILLDWKKKIFRIHLTIENALNTSQEKKGEGYGIV